MLLITNVEDQKYDTFREKDTDEKERHTHDKAATNENMLDAKQR